MNVLTIHRILAGIITKFRLDAEANSTFVLNVSSLTPLLPEMCDEIPHA